MFSVENMDSRARPLSDDELGEFSANGETLDWQPSQLVYEDGDEANPHMVMAIAPCWIEDEGDPNDCNCEDCADGNWTHGDWGYTIKLHCIADNEDFVMTETATQWMDAWRKC